jgi:hypothetical protein
MNLWAKSSNSEGPFVMSILKGIKEPPLGERLNVPATVRVVKCWSANKNDEEAIEDYVDLLRMCSDTEFTSYDLETGTCEFYVNHFLSYAVGVLGGSDYYISNSRRVATSSTPSTSMPSTSFSPSPSPTGPSPSSDTYSHVLRSQKSYTNPLRCAHPQGNPRLVSLVNQAYEYWKIQKHIPEKIRRKIDAIGLTNDEYLAVF